mgnify:CR=1 FL=1|jgi:hypothetical protein
METYCLAAGAFLIGLALLLGGKLNREKEHISEVLIMMIRVLIVIMIGMSLALIIIGINLLNNTH